MQSAAIDDVAHLDYLASLDHLGIGGGAEGPPRLPSTQGGEALAAVLRLNPGT